MAQVMTVRGPLPASELGVTLPHEHVFIDLVREYRGDGTAQRRGARGAGADGLSTGGRLRRWSTAPARAWAGSGRLRRVSEATGLNIIMGSGFYRRPYLDEALIDRL